MNSVESKVECNSFVSSWKPFIFGVEHESVKGVFPPGPHEGAGADKLCCHYNAGLSSVQLPNDHSNEQDGYTVPRSFGEILDKWCVEHNDVTNGVN